MWQGWQAGGRVFVVAVFSQFLVFSVLLAFLYVCGHVWQEMGVVCSQFLVGLFSFVCGHVWQERGVVCVVSSQFLVLCVFACFPLCVCVWQERGVCVVSSQFLVLCVFACFPLCVCVWQERGVCVVSSQFLVICVGFFSFEYSVKLGPWSCGSIVCGCVCGRRKGGGGVGWICYCYQFLSVSVICVYFLSFVRGVRGYVDTIPRRRLDWIDNMHREEGRNRGGNLQR